MAVVVYFMRFAALVRVHPVTARGLAKVGYERASCARRAKSVKRFRATDGRRPEKAIKSALQGRAQAVGCRAYNDILRRRQYGT